MSIPTFTAPINFASHGRFHRSTRYSQTTKCTLKPTSSPQSVSPPTETLCRAAQMYTDRKTRPAASAVAEGLYAAERDCKKLRIKSDENLLRGKWQLVLTSDKRARFAPLRSLYFPVTAQQTFTRDGRFENCVRIPGALLEFSGPFRWVPARNRLEFTFSDLRIEIGPFKFRRTGIDKLGSTLEGRSAKTLPFFTFFLVRPDLAAARGRSGGLALYARIGD